MARVAIGPTNGFHFNSNQMGDQLARPTKKDEYTTASPACGAENDERIGDGKTLRSSRDGSAPDDEHRGVKPNDSIHC